MDSPSPILDFYANKSVFLTGVTGFVGKVIVEKLLYSCPSIKNIYVLIRGKKNKTTEERFKQLLSSKAFSRINEKQLSKIIPIEGDLIKENFNLSSKDEEEIVKNVNIIIHSAATIKFNEPLSTAVELNVVPIRWIIKLARSLENLTCICYVSTAYTQCYKSKFSLIKEKVQEPPLDYNELITHVYEYAEEEIYTFSKNAEGKFPNSYTLTKAVAEYMFQEEGKGLPLVISRPSVVTNSVMEPLPGWTDTFHGMSGTIAGIITGVIRTWLVKEGTNDVVPVDIVSNCIVASIWFASTKRVESLFVCNCTSSNDNPTSIVQLIEWMKEIVKRKPIEAMVREPDFQATSSEVVYAYRRFTRHLIPAAVVDSVSPLTGRRTKMLDHYERIHASVLAMKFFSTSEWTWQTENQKNIRSAMSENDLKEFNFDMKSFKWKELCTSIVEGIDMFLLKKRDDKETNQDGNENNEIDKDAFEEKSKIIERRISNDYQNIPIHVSTASKR